MRPQRAPQARPAPQLRGPLRQRERSPLGLQPGPAEGRAAAQLELREALREAEPSRAGPPRPAKRRAQREPPTLRGPQARPQRAQARRGHRPQGPVRRQRGRPADPRVRQAPQARQRWAPMPTRLVPALFQVRRRARVQPAQRREPARRPEAQPQRAARLPAARCLRAARCRRAEAPKAEASPGVAKEASGNGLTGRGRLRQIRSARCAWGRSP